MVSPIGFRAYPTTTITPQLKPHFGASNDYTQAVARIKQAKPGEYRISPSEYLYLVDYTDPKWNPLHYLLNHIVETGKEDQGHKISGVKGKATKTSYILDTTHQLTEVQSESRLGEAAKEVTEDDKRKFAKLVLTHIQ